MDFIHDDEPEGLQRKSDLEKRCSMLLRELRRRKGLTLHGFEELSGGTVKAVVLGSYERGTRSISLARLSQIAELYEVPVQFFFTGERIKEIDSSKRLVFDLRRIVRSKREEPSLILVKKFLERIAAARSDWNGEVLSIRASDNDLLSLTSGIESADLEERLGVEGFLFSR